MRHFYNKTRGKNHRITICYYCYMSLDIDDLNRQLGGVDMDVGLPVFRQVNQPSKAAFDRQVAMA